ncbi:MAG: hypothetical protein ABI740_08995 [Alphaproteobacteria bacterium]
MIDTPNVQSAPVPRGILWLCRIMGWLCVLAIVFELGALVVMIVAPDLLNQSSTGGSVKAIVNNDSDVPLHDPVYLIVHGFAVAVFVWALLSVRGSFVSLSLGQFFTHRTITGLRNLAIGVLVYMALDPLAGWLAKTIHMLGQKHGELTLSFGISDQSLLMVIFTGAVIAISSALAHAARVAEENASFV